MNRIPRIRRWATGLAAAAIASLPGVPAALAIPLPPPGGGIGTPPPPPPSTTAAAHLPLWTVVTIVAATAVLSVTITLITLSLEHRLRARRAAAAPGPPAGPPTPPGTAEPPAGLGDTLSSYQHRAGHDMHRADNRYRTDGTAAATGGGPAGRTA
jgi:hypothetical protein